MNVSGPLISVIILNYNGARWLERCLTSLRSQSLAPQIEVIVADNQSTDGSDQLAEKLIQSVPRGVFIRHGANLGYCEGNNRAARTAHGKYLLFLNNDTWLEPDCLENLLHEIERTSAQAATPLVLNYSDDSFQSLGALGFDALGLSSTRASFDTTREVFMPEGCCYWIEREWFERLGGFDPALFMYSDEFDLSWRVWIAGGKAVGVPSSCLHHRGAAQVNPEGGDQVNELRTSDTKRFYANRNGLLVLLKNCQHILLLMVPAQLALLIGEAAASLVLVRRWSFVRKAYWEALVDCWHLRHHIAAERRRLWQIRCRSDFWMLRFLRWRFNRWDELVRMIRHGAPKVTRD
ncbi:MAG: glycosyltransferase family 2 protein [Verrucomicrobia bacterium]|nr:glycosyltransferase family 2 protein [Verrucomicrobiota bacterium]